MVFLSSDWAFDVQVVQWLHECVCNAQGELVLNFCNIWGTLGWIARFTQKWPDCSKFCTRVPVHLGNYSMWFVHNLDVIWPPFGQGEACGWSRQIFDPTVPFWYWLWCLCLYKYSIKHIEATCKVLCGVVSYGGRTEEKSAGGHICASKALPLKSLNEFWFGFTDYISVPRVEIFAWSDCWCMVYSYSTYPSFVCACSCLITRAFIKPFFGWSNVVK